MNKLTIFALLLLPFLLGAQTPAPCTDWSGYGPNDIPFVYDANKTSGAIIGWFDILGGQRASCSVNVCTETDEPISLSLLNAPNSVLLVSYELTFQTKKTDVGLYYVHIQAESSQISTGTVIYNILHDRRPKFGPIEKHQAKLEKYYAVAMGWLKE